MRFPLQKLKYPLLVIGPVVLSCLLSFSLNSLGLPSTFRIWEFSFRTNLLILVFLLYLLLKRPLLDLFRDLGLNKWDWRSNGLAFILSVLILSVTIGTGYLLAILQYQRTDNFPTIVLAAILDLPAIYFFSLFTLLIEEVLFRGVIFLLFSRIVSKIPAYFLSSLIWGIFITIDFSMQKGGTLISIIFEFLQQFSLGFLLMVLFEKTGSIWVSYSYRIGATLFLSMFLSQGAFEANSLFVVENSHLQSIQAIDFLVLISIALAVLKELKSSKNSNNPLKFPTSKIS